MKYFALILPILLTACVSVPVERKFPELPESLKTNCVPLQEVTPGTTKLSEVLSTVVTNYGQYHECENKVDIWQTWYQQQKEIFDSVK